MPKLTGLKKMKHSREFVVTKLLKVAETNAKRHSIEETLFGLHIKHNESSKGLIYCPPRSPKPREALIVHICTIAS